VGGRERQTCHTNAMDQRRNARRLGFVACVHEQTRTRVAGVTTVAEVEEKEEKKMEEEKKEKEKEKEEEEEAKEEEEEEEKEDADKWAIILSL
jgi:hypothetical protein